MHHRTHHPRLRRVARTIVFVLAAIVASLVVLEGVRSRVDTARHAASGRHVAVDGAHGHLLCHGEGGPTTVLVGGLGGVADGWAWVQRRLAADGRVCAHDRPGYGFSSFRPAVEDPVEEARLLADRLLASGERGPFVLVGHSLGGHYVRAFASAFPDQVAALVLVDARPPDIADRLAHHDAEVRRTVSMARWGVRLAPFGAIRAFGGGGATAAALPEDVRDATVAHLARADRLRRVASELEALPALDAATRHLELRADLPVLALTATAPSDGMTDDAWRTIRRAVHEAARTVPATEIRSVAGADHESLLTDEGHAGAVAEAIASWRAAVRRTP